MLNRSKLNRSKPNRSKPNRSSSDDDARAESESETSVSPMWLRIAAAVVLIAGIVLVVSAIVVAMHARGQRNLAAERDEGLDAAKQALINTQTFDTRDIPGSLARIESSLTGELLESWKTTDRASFEQQMQAAAQKNVRSKTVVVSAAVTEFDPDADTVKVLTYSVAQSYVNNMLDDNAYRWTHEITMTRVDGVWKASALVILFNPGVGSADPATPGNQQVPTTSAAPNPGAPTSGVPTSGAPTATPVTPAPVTPAPVTPAPVTPTPVTPAPVTPTPGGAP